MSHQSFYRKYRPQVFSDVVGQTHIERTLSNAVAEGTVAHAYLFTGPRGTGKTTTARILAKALNCEKGPTPTPDATCQDCIEIAEGRHPDVYELDAASRTGVDAVREEIISRVNYAPTRGRWKVYIIDEVHMLSTSAFNALLKTLEEPPAHTVFVLCTTHPHKVPETIQSRCQRFDFHRISVEDLVARLSHIAGAEKIEVAEGSLTLIAKHAAGGMRDAISTLEQLAAFTGNRIALDDVEGLLGEVDTALLFEVADVIARRDVAEAFRFVARLAEAGVDVTEFAKGMTGHFRDVYVVAVVGDATGVVDTTAEHMARLSAQAELFGTDRLTRILELLGELATQLRWTADPRLALEVALVRMARPGSDLTLAALAERVEALESGVVSAPRPGAPGSSAKSPRPSTAPKRGAAKEHADTGGLSDVEIRPATRGPLDEAAVRRAWPAVLEELKAARPARATLFHGAEASVEGDTLVLAFAPNQKVTKRLVGEPETMRALKRSISKVLGVDPPIELRLSGETVHAEASSAPVDIAEPGPVDETDTRPAPESENGENAQRVGNVERMLIDELGAELIVEHRHDAEE